MRLATNPDVRNAILGNIGSLIVFRVGSADARVLAQELTPDAEAQPNIQSNLTNHAPYEIYAKILVDGSLRDVTFGNTLRPLDISYGRKAILIEQL